jgi:ADP-ribosylglycohydrolase
MHDDFLTWMATGDAFGMKVEFVDHAIPVPGSALSFGPHPKFTAYQTGHYTDDTQMAMANATVMLDKGLFLMNADTFVTAWVERFAADPRVGYSKYMYALLQRQPTPAEFRAALDPTRGTTSGAAMRAAPFGLYDSLDMVAFATQEQAVVTHDTPAGRTSALAVALATHFFHHGGAPAALDSFLDLHVGKGWASPQNGLTDEPGNGLRIVVQALDSLRAAATFSDVLLAGVSQARVADTDTICAIASAIASRRTDLVDDVTETLLPHLEKGPHGVDELRALDKALMQRFPRSQKYATFGL